MVVKRSQECPGRDGRSRFDAHRLGAEPHGAIAVDVGQTGKFQAEDLMGSAADRPFKGVGKQSSERGIAVTTLKAELHVRGAELADREIVIVQGAGDRRESADIQTYRSLLSGEKASVAGLRGHQPFEIPEVLVRV